MNSLEEKKHWFYWGFLPDSTRSIDFKNVEEMIKTF